MMYLRQDLHMDLMVIIQKTPWICSHKMNLLKKNEAVLRDVPGELQWLINGRIRDNCQQYTLATIQAAKNQKQTNARGLVKLLNLKIQAFA